MAIKFESCRFKINPSSDQVPVVESDGDSELPCNELTGDTKPVSMVVTPIDSKGCLVQRMAGLCPRELGEVVDPALQMNGLAKASSGHK